MTEQQKENQGEKPKEIKYRTGLEGLFNAKPEKITPPTTEEEYLNIVVEGSPYKASDVVAVAYAFVQTSIFDAFSPDKNSEESPLHVRATGFTKRGLQESETPELKKHYEVLKTRGGSIADLATAYDPEKRKKLNQENNIQFMDSFYESTYVKTEYEELGGAPGPNGEKRVLAVNVYDFNKPLTDMLKGDIFMRMRDILNPKKP